MTTKSNGKVGRRAFLFGLAGMGVASQAGPERASALADSIRRTKAFNDDITTDKREMRRLFHETMLAVMHDLKRVGPVL